MNTQRKQKQWPSNQHNAKCQKHRMGKSGWPTEVLLPHLHIKLSLMKQSVKALQIDRNCFKYLCSKFPGLSEAKHKDVIFVESDI
jgi:hypothetical protein